MTTELSAKDRRKQFAQIEIQTGYTFLTYLHSGNAASGKVPEDIKNEVEQAPFIMSDLVPCVCSASAKKNRHPVI